MFSAFSFSGNDRYGCVTHNECKKLMKAKGVWPWGIQVGPFWVWETHFWKIKFCFIHKQDAAFPFLCMQGKGPGNERNGCMKLGQSNWTIWSPRNPFLQNKFPLYPLTTCTISFSCMHSFRDRPPPIYFRPNRSDNKKFGGVLKVCTQNFWMLWPPPRLHQRRFFGGDFK